MYEEIVKALRNCGSPYDVHYCRKCVCQLEHGGSCDCRRLFPLAADAIEELNRYVQQMEKLHKDGYYLQKTKMMTYGQAIMIMPFPESPKEET